MTLLEKSDADLLMKQLEVVRISSGIIRNHTTMVSNGSAYSNGAHIGNCIQLLLLVLPTASPALIRHTVFHDYPEFVTGDIVGDAKVKFPELKAVVDIIEEKIDKEFIILDGYDMNEAEQKFLKALDRLELYIWCLEQYQLGCRSPRFMKMVDRLEIAVVDFINAGSKIAKGDDDLISIDEGFKKLGVIYRRTYESFFDI
ncbi:hypothetical protein Ab1vBOLIVR5_gp239 [Agrobacterium phage OLIVR5]|uniref:Uncharacterized protein n=1 Tax=Agrobacterium phage OLIVR5 TaxID=2723773 RepID=A0A858MSY5_9CAUD|nr:hypothetical protein KNU99_gp162 [Agrobacterium phage OLIVR5]QIW87887.1 hypothetical protein Ab1vBOLIVR5_gp239 [Agrobacterium phage OLIVR5]QIW88152.1 hypothetical protein Ab1vBOLIVR6_gp245 [Agrobacterium phage OLIVR6]